MKIGAGKEAGMPEVSVVLPCRNEEKTIGKCIEKISRVLESHRIVGEIIVSDSSTDCSAGIARSAGAYVVKHSKQGYGNACIEGLKYAKGKYILIGDSDNTYDFYEIPKFLDCLQKENHDFVIGNRFMGGIREGAMPFMHRHIGNPLLSFISRVFFRTGIHDINCGFRGIKKELIAKLDLRTSGMEFASEMAIKAAKNNASIKEIPIAYYKREGKSKLEPFSDGWRHLRYMISEM